MPVNIRNQYGHFKRWKFELFIYLTAFSIGFLITPMLLHGYVASLVQGVGQTYRGVSARVSIASTSNTLIANKPERGISANNLLESQDISVNTVLKRMTLEQKVGQMLMVGFKGADEKGAVGFIRNYHVGGFIISRGNAISKGQLASLTKSLQRVSRSDSGLDLLLATDQEGGSVAHIGRSICPSFPSNAVLGAKKDEFGVGRQAKVTARVFHDVGLNMNLAPVLDVKTNPRNNVIGSRSYGSDPDNVARLGCAYIAELQRCGVIATAKHFPGHGSTSIDSHKDTPIANMTQKQILLHVSPFNSAIKTGVDAIMTAHVIYKGYDNRPATMSDVWIDDYLRRVLGYQGVVITDSLGMGAIRKHYAWSNVVKNALDAGVDIFLICEGDDLKAKTRQCILSAVRNGEVPESRIDESVIRILELKKKYGLIRGEMAAR